MKSCVIVGSEDTPSESHLRYNNLFPAIFILMASVSFKGVYLGLENTYERIAALEHARHHLSYTSLKLVVYKAQSTAIELHPAFYASACFEESGDTLGVIDRATHVLYVGYREPPSEHPKQAVLCLAPKEICDGFDDIARRLCLWLKSTSSGVF